MYEKYSLDKIKQINRKKLLSIIQDGKDFIKKDKTFKKMCDEYDLSTDVIDIIPMMFGDLEVSAKTMKGIIILNYKLLQDGDFFKDYSYMIHESQHYIQQCFNKHPTKSKDGEDYLDNKYEQEAFQYQIEYISDNFGEEEAHNYTNHLLDHHEIEDGTDRKDKKETLMAKV
jgi:hypothetical protein